MSFNSLGEGRPDLEVGRAMMTAISSLEAWIGHWILGLGAELLKRKTGARREVFEGEVHIPFLRIDRGHRETLLNLPGFSDEKETFLPVADALRSRFNVIIPDTVGFGETTRDPHRMHSLDNHTRWVTSFIEHLNCGSVWLMGNSLGGAIASSVALSAPHLVKKCIPVCSVGYVHSKSNPLFEEINAGENPFLVMNNAGYRAFIQRLFHEERRPIPFISAALRQKMIDERSWYGHVMEQLTLEMNFDVEHPEQSGLSFNERIASTSVPFHFIWGESDSFFDARIMDELKNRYPEVETALLERCGHCPHLEAPDRLSQVLLEMN